jgi:alkyl hydroperoxide reductase subunit AhpC
MVGKPAPDFEGVEAFYEDKFTTVSLSDYKGKWVILFFYPLDFTFVCPTEIQEFSAKAPEFKKIDAHILSVSTDSVYSHQAWKKDLGAMNFPMLADTNLDLSASYGVLIEEKGIALRGTFIIDPDGLLRASTVHDLAIGRNVDETLRTVKALITGDFCPVGWQEGNKTLGKA